MPVLYKNINTGKYFIRVYEIDEDNALFATPPDENNNVRIIPLPYNLFHDPPEEFERNELIEKGLVPDIQFKEYREAQQALTKQGG